MAYKDKQTESEHRRLYYQKNREARQAYSGGYKQKNRAKIKQQAHSWYERNKDRVKAQSKRYYREHRERHNWLTRKRRLEIKTEVLTHYGGGRLACVKCGETRLPCLTIDHISGGGSEHRRRIANWSICSYLKSNGLPQGYQTLCMNCQFIKKFEENETGWKKKTRGKEEDPIAT